MSSTFGGLNTVVRGLAAQQASLDTVGHNISNASTEGYSRQSVNLAATRPQIIYGANGENQLGAGVNIESITRARDGFIDKQMWKAKSSLAYSQTNVDILGNVEGAFNEPSDTGVQATMDKFWKSWQTLSTNASDAGTRTAVRQRGVEMVNAIQQTTQQLTDLIADTNAVIDIKVNNINQISAEMSALNHQIVTIEAGGADHANDLRDRRDLLVDQMSKMISVNVTQDKEGNYNIQSGGACLVDGNGYQKLATTITWDADYGYEKKNVVLAGDTQPLTFSNGELRGLIDMRDSATPTDSCDGIKGYLKKLDKMSEFLLKDFNNVHKAGRGTDNSTGHNFFGNDATDYNTFVPPTNTMGWIAELKVNPALFTSTTGLGLIAAKTTIDNMSIQQFNTAGGAATVDSTYTGTTPLNYVVRIDSVGAAVAPATVSAGNVTGISVSLNGGSWTAVAETTPSTVPKTFQIATASGPVTIRIATDTHNKKDDTYTFSVSQGNASGDNAVKLANYMKIDTTSTLGNSSLDSFYNSLIGALGVQTQSATSLVTNQTTMVGQITNWREAVSGINTDEEMSNMIRFQKGYNAAARVLTTMDEMLDKLINGTGVVGR